MIRSRMGVVPFVVTAMAVIAAQEAVVKLLTDDLSIWQLHILRSVMVVAFAVLAARLVRGLELRRLQRPGWAITRSALFSAAFFLLYSGLPFLSLAQSGAVFFTGPLWITLFAAVFLGERIGPRRIAALALGFSGVLVTAQPWREEIEIAILFPLCGAICYALGVMVTRGRLNAESALSLQVVHHVMFGIISVIGLLAVSMLPIGAEMRVTWPFLLSTWQVVGIGVWMLMALNALGNFIGALMLTHAYQHNEASGIAPLEYSYLAIAPLLDFAIWGTRPGWATLVGILLVAGAGIFIAWREGARSRRV